MGEASVLEMYFAALPQVVKEAAAPLQNVDNMTIYGSDGSTKVVSDVMQSTDQIMNAIKGATGIDPAALIAGFVGGKTAQNAE